MDRVEPEALTEQAALEFLETVAGAVPPEMACVELGVYQGASLAAIARGARGHVWGIDPWGMEGAYPSRPHMVKRYPERGRAIARAHLIEQGLTNFSLIRGFSVPEGLRWTGPEVGLLFIDAIHREREVLEDFTAWRRHLAPNAYVLFDDHDERFDGVRRAVARLVEKGHLHWEGLVGSRLAVLRTPDSATLGQNRLPRCGETLRAKEPRD